MEVKIDNNNINNNNVINNFNNKRNLISEFYKNKNQSRARRKKNRNYENNKNNRNSRNIGHIRNNIINKKESYNPVKRKKNDVKIKQKDSPNKKENNNDNVINIIRKREEQEQETNNKEDFPYGMKEKEMYDMFLKIYYKTDDELNNLDYEKALQFDYRTYTLYYVSLIRINHLFFFSFLPRYDYNSPMIKIFLFFFNFAVSFATNSLFFDDDTMHKIYKEKGAFDFIYNIPQIIISSLVSGFIIALIQNLAFSNSNIIDLKNNSNKKNEDRIKRQLLARIKIKLLFFFIISLLFLISFWIYYPAFVLYIRILKFIL